MDEEALKIGIIGAGHIGLTLAETFMHNFLPKQNLFISHGGSPTTTAKLHSAELTANVADNKVLCTKTDICFIAMRPQAFAGFKKIPVSATTQFVSCMAGVPLTLLKNIFGEHTCRIMTSGPETIKHNKAIVAIYPFNAQLTTLMANAGFKCFTLNNEHDMHYFTTAVCLPAALVLAQNLKLDITKDVIAFGSKHALFAELYTWAADVVPQFALPQQADEYVSKMATPGGITEAMVNSLLENRNFLKAVEAGINRGKQLSAMLNHNK